MIRGEAFIPAVPTPAELEAARSQTEASLKVAMQRRLYAKVTSLEEQLVAIKKRQLTIADEIQAGEAADELERLAALKEKPRAPWDLVENGFRNAEPLMFSLKKQEERWGKAVVAEAEAAAEAAERKKVEKKKAARFATAATAATAAATAAAGSRSMGEEEGRRTSDALDEALLLLGRTAPLEGDAAAVTMAAEEEGGAPLMSSSMGSATMSRTFGKESEAAASSATRQLGL
jgi:hypothetical protein